MRGSSSSLAAAPAARLSRSTFANTWAEASATGVLSAATHSGSQISWHSVGVWPVSASSAATVIAGWGRRKLCRFNQRIRRSIARRSAQLSPFARSRPTARWKGAGSDAAFRCSRPGTWSVSGRWASCLGDTPVRRSSRVSSL